MWKGWVSGWQYIKFWSFLTFFILLARLSQVSRKKEIQADFLPVPVVGIFFFLRFCFLCVLHGDFLFFFVQYPLSITFRNKWSHQNLRWVLYLSFVNVHSRSNCPIIDHLIRCTLLSSAIQFCSSSTFISLRRRDGTFTRCCSENMVTCYCEGKTFIDRIRLNYPYLKVFFWTFKTQSRNSERSWLFKCFKGLQMIPGIPVYWVVQKITYLEGPKKADKVFNKYCIRDALYVLIFVKEKLIYTATRVHRYVQTNEYHRYI